jgi:hypothetical protein
MLTIRNAEAQDMMEMQVSCQVDFKELQFAQFA